MKLQYENIIDKHKDTAAVIALHGPSLNKHKEKIEQLQNQKKVIRFSVNEWYDFFNVNPDYWVVSNGEFTVKASMTDDPLWRFRNYPPDVFNKYKIPLLYNSSVDLSEDVYLNKLKCDYFQYDIKHFKGHSCKEILLNFKKHYSENKNLEFYGYGNNCHMWQKPDVKDFPDWIKNIHGKIAGAWNVRSKCCKSRLDITLQEKLQQLSGYDKHAGPLATVGFCAISIAIMMGCNPIYISGLDLDYSLGYADSDYDYSSQINAGNIGHWKKIYKKSILNDMSIINESAKRLDKKIINLNKDSWYDVFTKGDLNL